MHLTSHTLKSYDQQLAKLMDNIQEMGNQVRELVLSAKDALRDRSVERLEDAKARDKRINALDNEIEAAATAILALQNPMAIDLRFVTSALKNASALERAGDMAKNTVKRSVRLNTHIPEPLLVVLESMADIVAEMIDGALNAMRLRDSTLATNIWKRDDAVDDLYHEFFSMIQQDMAREPERIPAGTHLVFMAKNFERIADYATNLAKTVHYVSTGSPADKSVLKT